MNEPHRVISRCIHGGTHSMLVMAQDIAGESYKIGGKDDIGVTAVRLYQTGGSTHGASGCWRASPKALC